MLLKIAKRNGLRLVIRADADAQSLEVYANFTDEAERQRLLDARIKKKKQVTVAGKFVMFGSAAVVLNDCRWES